jgi:hypothetical protein
VSSNRYVMPNLVVLTGIVMYATARLPQRRLSVAGDHWRVRVIPLALAALAIFLVTQVTFATGFGLMNGPATSTFLGDAARILLNEDRIPKKEGACEKFVALGEQLGVVEHSEFPLWFRDAQDGHLGEFQPGWTGYYRQLGPPLTGFPECQAPSLHAPAT